VDDVWRKKVDGWELVVESAGMEREDWNLRRTFEISDFRWKTRVL
jgi:hypothetical protein